jgi:hypothetical protein
MPDEIPKKALYIFIDESGNFDFTAKGTKYFALTAITTTAPLETRENLLRKVYDLKYEGRKEGRGDYYFHATEDKQEVRNWVFEAIKQLDDIEIDVILAQKNKANPSLYIEYEGNKTHKEASALRLSIRRKNSMINSHKCFCDTSVIGITRMKK